MRIMLVTDAWEPQVNGVVRTLSRTVQELREMGHEVMMVTPNDGYKTIPLPTYPEIKMALFAKDDIEERFEDFEPEEKFDDIILANALEHIIDPVFILKKAKY